MKLINPELYQLAIDTGSVYCEISDKYPVVRSANNLRFLPETALIIFEPSK